MGNMVASNGGSGEIIKKQILAKNNTPRKKSGNTHKHNKMSKLARIQGWGE